MGARGCDMLLMAFFFRLILLMALRVLSLGRTVKSLMGSELMGLF